ncbi:MAG: TerB family tellurite resistance protein [Deltaproteobacteria bacterium]|nr:TerB family tellurite resistance protein [Deltaproteobacteria bacterium]
MSIRAFLPIEPIASQEHADMLLELAFLVTAADGRLDPEEVNAFRELMGRVRGGKPTDADVAQIYERFTKELATALPLERVRTIGKRLPADLKEPAFRTAMALALIDRDASPKEDALIDVLFQSLALDAERAEALAKEVRVALSPPPGSLPPS